MNEKILKFEEKIWGFIEKYKFIIFFILITAMALLVRYFFLDFVSGDYKIFLKPWFNEIKENGGFSALNRDIGNYNIPYLTILAFLTYLPISALKSIKLVSIFFDFLCAFAMAEIASTIFEKNKNKNLIVLITYGVTLFLPTVILNSACWSQADSIYTLFILISILFLLKEKYFKAFVFLGISFAFKLQFIFILPLYILIYISKRKFPLYYFGIIPIMNLILCLPAIICGKSVISCLKIYFGQINDTKYINMNFPRNI